MRIGYFVDILDIHGNPGNRTIYGPEFWVTGINLIGLMVYAHGPFRVRQVEWLDGLNNHSLRVNQLPFYAPLVLFERFIRGKMRPTSRT